MHFAFENAPRPSATNGPRVAWFIEHLCTHSKGDLYGLPLILEPWQLWLLDLIFEVDPITGERVWRDVVVMLPRGNGKSTLAAGLGFYFLTSDGEGGADIVSAAYNDDQARIVWGAAASMREASETLMASTAKFHSSIVHRSSASSWKPISRKAAAAQGGNAHCVIFDEYHVQPTPELREVLRRGQKKRSRPMMLTITTEGDSEQSPLGELQRGFFEGADHEAVHEFLHVYRDRKARSILIRWGIPWEAELQKLDLRDPDLIRLCSPASWIDPDRVLAEGRDAPGQREADYVRYDLNGLVRDASSEGVPMSMWDACAGDNEFADDAELTLGVDIGFRRDWSAVVATGQSKADPERLAVQAWMFEPPRESGRELDLEATVGVCVDDLLETGKVKSICADPALAAILMQRWTMRGIEVREYRFAWGDAGPDSVAMLAAIQDRRFVTDGTDKQLRRHVGNLRVRNGPNGAWRWSDHPLKQTSPDFPNDAGIALMLSYSEWERMFGEQPEKVLQFFF